MRAPVTIPDAIAQLEHMAKFFFEGIYPKDRLPKMEQGGSYDPEFKDDSDLHLEIDGWLYITPFLTTEKYKVVGGERERDIIGFTIQKVSVTSGCTSGPAEDCYPDDVSVEEVDLQEPLNHPISAIEYVCKALFQNELDQVWEAWSESQMAIEEEKEETYA